MKIINILLISFLITSSCFGQDQSEQKLEVKKEPAKVITRNSSAELVPNVTTKKIKNLSWTNKTPAVVVTQREDLAEFVITLEGKYTSSDWTLIGNNQKITPNEDGSFVFKTQISKTSLEIEFTAIGPLGEIEKEDLGLLYTDWQIQKETVETAPPKKLFVSGGLGITNISYKEDGYGTFKSIAMTGKFSTTYLLLPPRWDVGFSGFFTLLNLTKSPNVSARFLGLNARAGYTVPSISDPWKFSIFGGLYYTTMLTSPSSFGFTNMSGLQLFPVLRKKLKDNHAVSGYFKFSPVSQGFGFKDLSNREIAFGLSYSMPLKTEGRSLNYTFDIANIAMKLSGTNTVTKKTTDFNISSTSITLGASYSL